VFAPPAQAVGRHTSLPGRPAMEDPGDCAVEAQRCVRHVTAETLPSATSSSSLGHRLSESSAAEEAPALAAPLPPDPPLDLDLDPLGPPADITARRCRVCPDSLGQHSEDAHLHPHQALLRLPALEGSLTLIKFICHNINTGSIVQKSTWVKAGTQGVDVVEKRFARRDDALTEIGFVNRALRDDSLVGMLGCFASGGDFVILTSSWRHDVATYLSIALKPGTRERVRMASSVSHDMLEAITYLHGNGIGHCDIKLENFVTDMDYDIISRVVLIDFGLVRLLRNGEGGPTHRYFGGVGTEGYWAPECFTGEGDEISHRTPDQRRSHRMQKMLPEYAPGGIVQVDPYISGGWIYHVVVPPLDGNQPHSKAKAVECELAGFEAAPLDLFAAGRCIFYLYTDAFPFAQAQITTGNPEFNRLWQKGLRNLMEWQHKRGLGLPPGFLGSDVVLNVVEQLLRCDPTERGTAEDALTALRGG